MVGFSGNPWMKEQAIVAEEPTATPVVGRTRVTMGGAGTLRGFVFMFLSVF